MSDLSQSGASLVDISRPRYDQDTFIGRLRHFITVTSPLTLLASTKQLEDAKETVSAYQNAFSKQSGAPFMVARAEAQQYWKAKQLVDSSLHPDTGDTIFLPFRMSAFVPSNLPIILGMLTPNASMGSIVFWQWANQSLNVAVNYSNANKAGPPMSTQEIATAYGVACTAAVGISLGLTQTVPRLRGLSATTRATLSRLVPFVAVASAGTANLAAMRYRELKDGVQVFRVKEDGSKEDVGQSAVAGRRAVGMTAASRILTNMPILVLPPLAMSFLQARRLVPTSGVRARLTEAGIIGVCLMGFLPPAIATFPQTASISVNKLEPRFQSLRDETGAAVETLFYNKGL